MVSRSSLLITALILLCAEIPRAAVAKHGIMGKLCHVHSPAHVRDSPEFLLALRGGAQIHEMDEDGVEKHNSDAMEEAGEEGEIAY
jgi:hypothetical protein